MIVDFEQDPSEPYGTGNFRDDKGRVMYLHDPATASQFNKTMRGAPLGQRVAEESTALATEQLGGAPQRGPDTRLASVGTPPATAKSRGQALVESFEQTKASLAPGSVSAPTGGVATADEEFLATTTGAEADEQAEVAAPVAPITPGASASPVAPSTPEQQRIAQMVDATANAQPSIARRSQKTPPTLPKPHDPGGIPKSGVRSGETLSVEEGRPMENVQEELAASNSAFEARKAATRELGSQKLAAQQREARGTLSALNQEFYQDGTAAFAAQNRLRQAETEVAKLNKAIADNDRAYDPDRYVRSMSTGSKIAMVILAALNGGFNATIGKKNNDVLDILRGYINDDLEAQKLTIGSRDRTLRNQLEHFKKQGFDASQAEALARSKQIKNVVAYAQLQTQLMAAPDEAKAQVEAALAELERERVKEESRILKEAEDKRSRAYQESQAHEVPPPSILSPSDLVAMSQLNDRKIEAANAEEVSLAVDHPVTAAEAQRIRTDASEYGKRQGQIATTRNLLKRVAQLASLRDEGGRFSGDPDAGWMGTAKRRQLEMAYTLLQRADIMNMTREPSQDLQLRFAALTSRPFWDSDIKWQLNQLSEVLDAAQTELQSGYGQDVVRYYHRDPAKTAKRAAAAPSGKPQASPQQRANAAREHDETRRMMREAEATDLDERDE